MKNAIRSFLIPIAIGVAALVAAEGMCRAAPGDRATPLRQAIVQVLEQFGFAPGTTTLAVANGGTGGTTASASRTSLGLVIGTDVQAFDAQLTDVAAITPTVGGVLYADGTNIVRTPDPIVTTLTTGTLVMSDDLLRSSATTMTIGATGATSTVVVDRGASNTFGDVTSRNAVNLGQQGYFCARATGSVADGYGLFQGIFETSATAATLTCSASGTSWEPTTLVTLGNAAGWVTTASSANFEADNLPYCVVKFRLDDTVDVRFNLWLSNDVTLANNTNADNPTATRYVGLQFSNDALAASRDDTFYQWVEDNATTQTVTSTAVTPAAGTVLWLEIDVQAVNSIVLTLRNTSWATLSTRTVTSSPFTAGTAITLAQGIQQLGSTDTKDCGVYVASMALRVGTP